MNKTSLQSIDQLTAWINTAKAGEDGFRHIYHFYLERIYNYVFQRVNHVEIAEDVVADIFCSIADAFKDFRGDGHVLTAWVYQIAHNRIKTFYREKSRTYTLVLDEKILHDQQDTATPFVEDLTQKDEVAFIKKAMQLLTEEESELIALRYFEGLARKQLATMFSTREGTIATRISRAVQKLRDIVQSLMKESHYAT